METVRGWVYVITNKAIPGLVKVGYTLKDPNVRARELDGTGMPHPYVVEYEVFVEGPREIERLTHSRLSCAREAKEWFRCGVSAAISEIQAVVGSNVILQTRRGESDPIATSESTDADEGPQPVSSEHVSPRPIGTYTGDCWYCRDRIYTTLTPEDIVVRCPECFRHNDAKNFVRQELYV